MNAAANDSLQTAMEEGLLIDDSVETGYGTIQSSEPLVEQPTGKAVKKKSKRNHDGLQAKGKEASSVAGSE